MIGKRCGSDSGGLNTRNRSGSTEPCTIGSPRPQVALIVTTPGNPLSVSSENMMPEPARSARTMRWMPIDSATAK